MLTGGLAAARGRLDLVPGAASAMTVAWNGDVTLRDVEALDPPTGGRLFAWRALALQKVKARSVPVEASVGSVALSDFYARLIVYADGSINLAKLSRSGADGRRSRRPLPLQALRVRSRPGAPEGHAPRSPARWPRRRRRRRRRCGGPSTAACRSPSAASRSPEATSTSATATDPPQLFGEPHAGRRHRLGALGLAGGRGRDHREGGRGRAGDDQRSHSALRARAARSHSPAGRGTSSSRRCRRTRQNTPATASPRASSRSTSTTLSRTASSTPATGWCSTS